MTEQTILKVVVCGAVCLVGLAAGYNDWRWRRIPNWLTYPAAMLAVVMRWWLGGASAAFDGIIGMAFAFVLMGLLFAGGMMGGGDVKLAAAMGAWVGLATLPRSLFFMAVFGAALSLVMAARRLVTDWRSGGRKDKGEEEASMRLTIPYGLAIGAGALVALVW